MSDVIVKVGADISELSRGMRKATDAIKGAGGSLQAIGGNISATGDKLTRSITTPALAATSALVGITLVKGFSRLVGIDTARAKLIALGHDAESVENIMTSALDSVRGTAYGLDEAATTAASAVAAGIKPGQDLTKYLSLAGDAAAIAGVSMGEMGSIFNKVETAQRAYTAELNQLADRGIPIYQWLAEEAGVSAEAIRDAASKGEISSEQFRTAIENNIGGAAKVFGENSFTASLANVGAAIGRIGANFLDAGGKGGGFFSTVKPLIGDFQAQLERLEPLASDLGSKFGEAFNAGIEKVKELKAQYDALTEPVKKVIAQVTGIAPAFLIAIGPAIKIVGLLVSAIGFILSPVGLVIAGVALLAAGIAYLWKESETFRETATNAFLLVKDYVMQAVGAIVGFAKTQMAELTAFWQANGTQILEAMTNVWNGIKAVIDFVMPAVLFIIKSVWENIKGVISGALDIIMGVIKVFAGLFTGDFSKMWEGIKQIFGGAIEFVWNLFNLLLYGRILKAGKALFTGLKGAFTTGWNALKTNTSGAIKAIDTFVSNGFKAIWNGIVNVFKNIGTSVANGWNAVRTGTSTVIEAIKTVISNGFNAMRTAIGNIMGKVKTTISTKWDDAVQVLKNINLFQIGKNIIQGLINGISGMFGKVKGIVSDIAKLIPDGVANFLKIKSPSRVMRDMGKWTALGLVDGIDREVRAVERASDRMASAALIDAGYTTPSVSARVPSRIANEAVAQSNAGTTYGNVNVTISAKDVAEFNSVVDFFGALPQAIRKA